MTVPVQELQFKVTLGATDPFLGNKRVILREDPESTWTLFIAEEDGSGETLITTLSYRESCDAWSALISENEAHWYFQLVRTQPPEGAKPVLYGVVYQTKQVGDSTIWQAQGTWGAEEETDP